MTKLNIDSGFGVRVPATYREYKELLDLLKDNGVQVKEELFYDPEYYPDSVQSRAWYMMESEAYNARIWNYWGVIRQGDKLVTSLADGHEPYPVLYDSVGDMLQALTEKSSEGVDLSDRIEGFDAYEITLSVGDKNVSFTSASQAELGNKANDPIPALTYLRTLEQVEEALKDDSVTILWGLGSNGALIRPTHLTQDITLTQVARMMQQGIYVAAKK